MLTVHSQMPAFRHEFYALRLNRMAMEKSWLVSFQTSLRESRYFLIPRFN